jgi:hypothetical protein
LARKLVCDLIDGPDGFNDPSSSKHPDLRPYRKSWIMAFTPTIAAANAGLRAENDRLTARAESAEKALAEARKSALDDLRSLLRERSKGEVETWGFVAAFMEMIDEIDRKPQAALAGEAPKPGRTNA